MEVDQDQQKPKKAKKGEKGGEPLPMATGSGEIVKMEIDYSDTCDKQIPEAEALAKGGNLAKALELLIGLEKQTRMGGDMISTGRILVSIVQLCHQAQDWARMKEEILALTKRRGQLKQAVVKMVQEVMTYLDKFPDTLKLDMINTLRDVTEGKIYVEVERARLTHTLALMKEAEGKIVEAANILQELQVETYGSMEKREKVELILEQMRFCLAKKDYIRTQIISKKINVKYFEDEGTHDLKLKFYELMIEMDQHDGSYLSICRHVRAMLKTPSVEENSEKKKQLLRAAVLYVVLSPYDNEQFDLLHRMLEDKALDPLHKRFLGLFKNQELINWKELCAEYEKELKSPSMFTKDTKDTSLAIIYGVFDSSELGVKRWQNLKDRVVEHNIRIMAKYYTRVSLKRMSHLLDLKENEVEEVLCSMVVSGTVQGKIDRPTGIVSFQQVKDPSELLNDWSHNVNTLMTLIARTTHLINKEEMVHRCLFNKKSTSGPSFPPSAVESEENLPMETES